MIGGEGLNWCGSFTDEARDFERNVYLLVLGTLRASLEYLTFKTDVDASTHSERLKVSENEGEREWLIEQLDSNDMNLTDQHRFLRNMALVALSSQLTHTLQKLAAEGGDVIGPQMSSSQFPKKQGGTGSEYERLWDEFHVRFGIDFSTDENKPKIAFVRTMADIRNQIVHRGGEANTWIRYDLSVDLQADSRELDEDELRRSWQDLAKKDLKGRWFSNRYPEFVEGAGKDDSGLGYVQVSEQQLTMFTEHSLKLVYWLSGELTDLCTRTQKQS